MWPCAYISYALHGLQQVFAGRSVSGVRPGGIKPPTILQPVIGVKAEHVGGANCAVCFGGFLCLVNQIGKGKAVLLGEFLHIVERIVGVIIRIVGHDGGDSDSNVLQGFGVRNKAVDDRLYIGAMVADKGDDCAFIPFDVGE